MASATDSGAVYHVQQVGGIAAVVTYRNFRTLLASQVDDVDNVLGSLVPDAGVMHTGQYSFWVTLANGFVPPPRATVGAPAGVAAVVTHGMTPPAVTTVSVKGKKPKERDKD